MSVVSRLGQIISLRAPLSLEKRLVDAESEIGGRIVSSIQGVKHQRFWFYNGYWHYEEHYMDGTTSVVSYQFTDLQAYKLYNGKEVPFTEPELSHVVDTIKKYHTQIKSELYSKVPTSLAV